MKKNFIDPKLCISVFDSENIVTVSGGEKTAARLAEDKMKKSDFYNENATQVLGFVEF